MIEEVMNFGMNTAHILQINDLNENVDKKVDDLNKALHDIASLQNSMKQKQLGSIAIQEKTFQQQQHIQELRNSVFNLKTSMEEVYQSNVMSEVVKYFQFRDICASPAMKAFEVNHYLTFEDKEYVSAVKKYLFYSRDELFNSFNDNIQKILREIEDKENQLLFENAEELAKPIAPVAPLSANELKQMNEKKPIKPSNYYRLSASEYEIGATNGESILFINSSLFKSYASVILFIILAIVLLKMQLGGTLGLISILIVIAWILLVPYPYYVEKIELPKIKQFYAYKIKLKKYKEQQNKIKENNKILECEDSNLEHYKEQLKKIKSSKIKSRNLKNEIITLHKMLNT